MAIRRTPEGLTIEETSSDQRTTVRERGHGGYLVHKYEMVVEGDLDGSPIWKYREEPDFLIERLHDLEQHCSAPDAPASSEFALNLDMARRRLRRWHREWGNPVLRLPPGLQAVAQRAFDGGSDELRDDEISELIVIDELILAEYYRRKASTRPLILRVVPAHLTPLIQEANEAFAHGLWRSCIAICRCMLEDVVRRIVRAQMHRTATPRSWRDFRALLNCIPEDVLSPKEKKRTLDIFEQGNRALHSAEEQLTEGLTRRVLTETSGLIEAMIRNNGLHRRDPPATEHRAIARARKRDA